MNKITLILIYLTLSLSTNYFSQTTFTQIRKLSNVGSGDNFGWKVDIDGDYAVTANYHKNATDRGEVYIYHRHEGGFNNWGAVDTLEPSTLINNSWFGTSLAISGTTIMVVAKSSSVTSGNGMAYIFDPDPINCNQWTETGRIISPTSTSGQWLGIINADLEGDVAVLGNLSFPAWQGLAAQIYYRNHGGTNNWGRVTTITSSDYDNADGHSWDVNLSGDDLILGAYLANNSGSRNGAAYIFNRNQGGADNWGQVRKIVASDGAFDDDFGISVAIDGDLAVVGAQADDNGSGTNAGAAYVFSRNQGGTNNWGEIRKIIGSTVTGGNLFGADVTIHNDLILVAGFQTTSAYLFQQNIGGTNNWGETQIISPIPLAGGWYGHDCAIADGAIIIGAPNDNSQAGAIYFSRSIVVDTPAICNNITSENLNTIFSPFRSDLWIGPGVFNDSLLNTTGLSGVIEYIAVSGTLPCQDSVRRHIRFDTVSDANFTTSDFCNNIGHSVTITGDTGGVFSFSPPPTDGANINASTGEITNFTLGNSYSIKYVVGTNCPDSTTQSVTALNTLTTSVNDTICLGDSLLFNNTHISDTGSYLDTLTSLAGCDSIINLILYIDSTKPILSCVPNQTNTIQTEDCEYTLLNYTSAVNLTSPTLCNTSNYQINQIPSPGTVIQVTNSTISIPVEIRAINTIINDTVSCNFSVDIECINPLIIPEFISPNGDGMNDSWFIEGLQNFSTNKVKIFNRYGTLIYSIDNYENDWQGEINSNESLATLRSSSKLIPSGTYFYILELPNEDLIYTGIIQLMK